MINNIVQQSESDALKSFRPRLTIIIFKSYFDILFGLNNTVKRLESDALKTRKSGPKIVNF